MDSALTNPTNNQAKSLHVLHIASGDLWAGAEVMLYTLTKALHLEFDTRVTVILLNPGTLEQKLRDCGISVHIFDETLLNSFQIYQQLNICIKELNPNIIHTHRLKENILGSLAALRINIPSIRTAHGAPEHKPPIYKLPKRLILLFDRLLGRYCQKHVIAVSTDLSKKLRRDFPQAKIKVIENGADIDSIICSAPPVQTRTNNNYHIGIAGRLVQVKRFDLFIQTAIYLKQHHPELLINFYIYGDGPLLEPLQAQAQKGCAENYVHFKGHSNNIAKELQTLDALVMISDHEGLPMILLEAMCMQVPIIAHAVGGVPNLLDQGNCGILINSQTPEAFAGAIVDLIKEPEQHQKLALQALERLKQYYSAKQTAANYLKIYEKLADQVL